MDDPVQKLFELWEVLSKDDKAWYEYRARRKASMDEYSARFEAEERGEERGEKKGRLEVARKLLGSGVDLNIIAESTGCSIEELERLREQLH